MKSKIISFLIPYGEIEVLYPKYENQGSRKAIESYCLYLKEGIELSKELLNYCKINRVLIQNNLFKNE